MQPDILIIGGGLSGLAAAWQLHNAGKNILLLEARNRLGGRIMTYGVESGANCDMGPSWIWSGQPLVASLLTHFNIPHFQQYSAGAYLYEQVTGEIVAVNQPSPMAGAWRVEGGIQRLTDALAAEIPASHLLTEHVVESIMVEGNAVTVTAKGATETSRFQAKQVGIAIPPRLAAELIYQPPLPAGAQQALAKTPTWMAGQAKFFAVYDKPFWRAEGLSGTAMSRRGPLAEIHDVSPDSGAAACLFGFVGMDAATRTRIGRDALIRLVMSQLERLFGKQATQPTAMYLQDWSTEPFTAADADRQPLREHPQYGLSLGLGVAWEGKIAFISSESAHGHNGGLIEGALEAGLGYAQRLVG